MMEEVELFGGPYDGQIVHIRKGLLIYQKTRFNRTFYQYADSNRKNAKGQRIFTYDGIKGG